MKKLLFAFMAVTMFACSSDDSTPGSPNNGNPENPNPENPNPVEECLEYTGDVNFLTQQQIAAFAAKGYCKINGDLKVGGSEITDLSGLIKLKEVTGSLQIAFAENLQSLHGLENIEKVRMLVILKNDNLISLSALANLKQIGEFDNQDGYLQIDGNALLHDLTGLEGLKAIAVADIGSNNALVSLNGLNNIEKAGSIEVSGNSLLTSLEGLNSLKEIYSIYIKYSHSLSSLSGLGNLEELIQLYLLENNSLISLAGLEKITKIESVHLSENTSLTSLNALNNVTHLASFHVYDSPILTSLSGLENVSTMTGLTIQKCPGVTTMEALSGLTQFTTYQQAGVSTIIQPSINIIQTGVSSLAGLENITQFTGSLTFKENSDLTNFCAVNAIINTASTVTIIDNSYNPSIQSILDGNCSQ